MFTEFASLLMPREELREIREALIQRAMVEDGLRRERGQEKIHRHALLEKIEMLLGERAETARDLDRALDDELWEFSWYAFTDEWAWFRAKRDVELELGAEALKKTDAASFEKLVEARYRKLFESYVAEVDMLEDGQKTKLIKKQPKASRISPPGF